MLCRRSLLSTRALTGVLLTTCVAASSCAGALSGDVAGERVPAFTAAGVLHASVAGTEQWLAYFASAGEGCALLNPLLASTVTDDQAAQVAIFRAHTPTSFWYATVSAFGIGDNALDRTTNIDLNAYNTQQGAAVIVCHRNRYPTFENGVVSVDDDCFYAASGELQLQYSNDLFDIETPDELRLETPSGDNAGKVTLSGRAPTCDAGSDAFTQLLSEGVDDQQQGGPANDVCTNDDDCAVLAKATGSCTTTADCSAGERCVVQYSNNTVCVLPLPSVAAGCLGDWLEVSTTEGDNIGLCDDSMLQCNADGCE